MMDALALLVATFCLAVLGDQTHEPSGYVYRENSIQKPYQTVSSTWDVLGKALINNDDFIRLTPASQSVYGAIWNKRPCLPLEWEATLQFDIHGESTNLFGDGFALWYTAERMVPGAVFGNQDRWNGLAIFLDTYGNHHHKDHGHPYISAMLNNGRMSYDHDTDGSSQELAGCQAIIRNFDFPTFMRVVYRRQVLKVSLDVNGQNIWQTCFIIRDLVLPPGYFFGLSASTGDLSDNHDIVSFQLSEAPAMSELDVEEENAMGSDRIYKGVINPIYDNNYDGDEYDEAPGEGFEAEDETEPHMNSEHGGTHGGHDHAAGTDGEGGGSTFWIIIIVLAVLMAGAGIAYKVLTKPKQSKYNF